jgi:hypothetical protein
MIGCGGIGPGQPTGLAVMGLAVIGGQWLGTRDGGVRGWRCIGAASGCGEVRASRPGAAVVATAELLGLAVGPAPRLACDDVQAALNTPISTSALSVVCLVMVMVIGL